MGYRKMKIQEKTRKPMMGAKYLNVENTDEKRNIPTEESSQFI